jgi:hypothetical protein
VTELVQAEQVSPLGQAVWPDPGLYEPSDTASPVLFVIDPNAPDEEKP